MSTAPQTLTAPLKRFFTRCVDGYCRRLQSTTNYRAGQNITPHNSLRKGRRHIAQCFFHNIFTFVDIQPLVFFSIFFLFQNSLSYTDRTGQRFPFATAAVFASDSPRIAHQWNGSRVHRVALVHRRARRTGTTTALLLMATQHRKPWYTRLADHRYLSRTFSGFPVGPPNRSVVDKRRIPVKR